MFPLERKYPLCYNIPYEGEYGGGYSEPKVVNEYMATDGQYVYKLEKRGYSAEFAYMKLTEPKIKLSNFDGCPHWYGIMFMPNGVTYELQCKITKKYLDDAHQMRGDWTGYKEGDYTARFLSKTSVMSAFNLFKEMLT